MPFTADDQRWVKVPEDLFRHVLVHGSAAVVVDHAGTIVTLRLDEFAVPILDDECEDTRL